MLIRLIYRTKSEGEIESELERETEEKFEGESENNIEKKLKANSKRNSKIQIHHLQHPSSRTQSGFSLKNLSQLISKNLESSESSGM